MVEYGVKVIQESKSRTSKEDLYALHVYFTPMSYFDWIYFSQPESSYDPAYIRGIFLKYITRIKYEPLADKTEIPEYEVIQVLDEDDNIKMKIVNAMLIRAGFDDEKTLLTIVSKCRDKSMTLAGAYDTFVMINTDFSFYAQFLNSDIFTRAQIISSLEKMKHFTVEDRYLDAIKEKIDINLTYPPKEYEDWKFEQNKKQTLAKQGSASRQAMPDKKEVVGENINDLLDQSRVALAEAMKRTKTEPAKFFDWEKDEQEFGV